MRVNLRKPSPPLVPAFECPACGERYFSARTICRMAGRTVDDLADHDPVLVRPLELVAS